jgi:hypothetical protein
MSKHRKRLALLLLAATICTAGICCYQQFQSPDARARRFMRELRDRDSCLRSVPWYETLYRKVIPERELHSQEFADMKPSLGVLIEGSRDQSQSVRMACAIALSQRKEPKATEVLISMIKYARGDEQLWMVRLLKDCVFSAELARRWHEKKTVSFAGHVLIIRTPEESQVVWLSHVARRAGRRPSCTTVRISSWPWTIMPKTRKFGGSTATVGMNIA